MDEVYMNDSVGQKSYAFDFDLDTGNISNRRLLVDMRGTGGEPDGLVVEYETSVDPLKI
jgi:sugar lactone lactonase YvrE